jgi:hypothetical protein
LNGNNESVEFGQDKSELLFWNMGHIWSTFTNILLRLFQVYWCKYNARDILTTLRKMFLYRTSHANLHCYWVKCSHLPFTFADISFNC